MAHRLTQARSFQVASTISHWLHLDKWRASAETTRSQAISRAALLRLSGFNVVALVALAAIVTAAGVVRIYQLVILLPVLVIIVVSYWRLRTHPTAVACCLGVSFALLGWIFLCENIVRIDNALGTQVLRKLILGPRLMAYAAEHISGAKVFQECCNDSLTYNLKPGSIYRETYDCNECNPRYEVVVDETGYLNRQGGLLKNNDRIDLFLAGDSVMQGIGVPGVLEFVKDEIPVTMWNISMAGYGPRQKVNAAMAYALPKKPRWLIVEFFSGNDVTDAIESEVCCGNGNFRSVMNKLRIRRRLSSNPVFASMVSVSMERFELFDDYVEESLTLAMSRYSIDRLKSLLRPTLVPTDYSTEYSAVPSKAQPLVVSVPATTDYYLKPGQRLQWAQAGMIETHKQYRRLVARIAELETKPVVILLYDPAGYEIYRDILVDRQPEYDQVCEFQIEAQRAFAEANGWRFIDLTSPLRTKLDKNTFWIYGRHDSTHWSHQGTAFVAKAMAEELRKVMAQ
jgi:hypothetical protein